MRRRDEEEGRKGEERKEEAAKALLAVGYWLLALKRGVLLSI